MNRLKLNLPQVYFSFILLISFLFFSSCKKESDRIITSPWSISIFEGTTLSDLAPRDNAPVLNYFNVTDMNAEFVADPFMIKKDNVWYMFFEVFDKKTNKGSIGYATSSDDTKSWTYQKVILSKPWHLSFPYIFEYNNSYFLLPEASQSGVTTLYRAIDFPDEWSEGIKILDTGLQDPFIFKNEGTWFLFGTYKDDLHIYYSDHLSVGWVEHPSSPIFKNNSRFNRLGGNIFFDGSDYYRITQDDKIRYGRKIHIFKILRLSKTEYVERLINDNPNLCGGKFSWAKNGIHTVDAHKMNDSKIIAAVDGQ